MSRRQLFRFGLVFVSVLLLTLLGRFLIGRGALAESNTPAQREPVRLKKPVARAGLNHSFQASGSVVTQTFELREGWTAIYLEVEPINTSPLVNKGSDTDPLWVHAQPVMETVFSDLIAAGVLESVWTWNVPLTTVDYIVDPSEGLWDEPGWKRYFPPGSVGPDGESLEFLSDLFTLYANTAYLVKLKAGAGPRTLVVAGHPVVAHHQWLPDSYNLAGFPIDPGANPQPTVATFLRNLAGGASALTEIRALQADGNWGDALADNAVLNYGEAYLVYFSGGDPQAATDYTAPLDIISYIGDSLDFTPGFSGHKQTVRIQNLANNDIAVQLQLVGQVKPPVALQYDSDPESDADPLQPLWPNPATLSLSAGQAVALNLVVPMAEQAADGDALLAIRSPELGARWLVPITARRGDYAGLWIGEVVVNDVSEGRLGGTNVGNGELTIALRPRDFSGLQGAAHLVEMPAGNTASVALTATLALPTPAPADLSPLQPVSATAPYVAGYVFVDSNQNGQRDGDERGLAGVTVTLGNLSAQTAADGLYVFEGVAAGSYVLALNPAPPGYTSDFPVTLPQATSGVNNATPTTVVVAPDGISALEPDAYRRQVLSPPYTLPQYDADDNRVEPLLNFGLTPIYDVSLWTGQCSDRQEKRRDLDPMLNGFLATTLTSAALNPGYTVDDLLLGSPSYVLYIEKHGANGAAGQGIACGEIVVGAPTRFADGRGSEFRFRVLLRVDQNGRVELLPDYANAQGKRVSAANFSIQAPVVATGANFGDTSGRIDFSILIDPNDPLNPYKHKYHPDHDNLDAKFNPIDLNTVDPSLWESYEVRRRMQLVLTEGLPVDGASAEMAANLDWGGGVWGGLYKEVIEGIHKNDITVRGYFVIRHALTWEELTPQGYDQAGGGG